MTDSNEDYTVDELEAMDDYEFGDAVTEDLEHTGHHLSAFQDRKVVGRTLTALLDKLWSTDATLRKHADDPNCSAEKWGKMKAFRRYLLSAIDITQRRMEWQQGPSARTLRAWRAILDELVGEIEETELDFLLDEMKIPFDNLTLRQWKEIRDTKRMNMAPKREGEMAA